MNLRTKNNPGDEPPLHRLLELPTGSVLDAYPLIGYIDGGIRNISNVQELVRFCEHGFGTHFYNAFWQEAAISRFLATHDISDAESNWLESLDLGIHPRHPLFNMRQSLVGVAEQNRSIDVNSLLLVWGTLFTKGKPFFERVGVLLQDYSLRLVVERPDHNLDLHTCIRWWALASGVRHASTLRGLERLLRAHTHSELNALPENFFAKLSYKHMRLAEDIARVHGPMMAFYFFRAMQRIRACMKWVAEDGAYHVRWRSTWLRGAKTNSDAIRGASTYQHLLKPLLLEHVLEKVAGHRAGKRAATYRLKLVLEDGRYDEQEAAKTLGLTFTGTGLVRPAG
ncbi:hypothetical protein [Archangium sp.]|jgi:hypothetical protein|uniref:hypothetical protein n=1 Tax=Archangium sp. TaxID=1872627 RepID=UPI002EDBA062